MNLYQINNQITDLIDSAVDIETGEIAEDVSSKIDALIAEKDQKILNCAKYIKNRSAYVDAIRQEIKSLQERAKREEKKLEWLEGYVKNFMVHGEKYEDAQCAVSLRRSARVDIVDLNVIPAEFKKEKIEVVADKKLITDAIKNGQEVAGAKLTENYSLAIK